jgi:hypothetical protein
LESSNFRNYFQSSAKVVDTSKDTSEQPRKSTKKNKRGNKRYEGHQTPLEPDLLLVEEPTEEPATEEPAADEPVAQEPVTKERTCVPLVETCFRIQVSAKHLIFASSIFKKILTGGWKESVAYLEKG